MWGLAGGREVVADLNLSSSNATTKVNTMSPGHVLW